MFVHFAFPFFQDTAWFWSRIHLSLQSWGSITTGVGISSLDVILWTRSCPPACLLEWLLSSLADNCWSLAEPWISVSSHPFKLAGIKLLFFMGSLDLVYMVTAAWRKVATLHICAREKRKWYLEGPRKGVRVSKKDFLVWGQPIISNSRPLSESYL